MHPQEERFEHIKDELEKAGIDFDEYRYEEGALEIFSSYSSLKKLAPWCLSRIHIEYERIMVRLTGLGIRQVPKNVIEAARSFGATPRQLLFKVQLPLALPTILTGINQTIMMALSMVVVSAMISAGGLGEVVLKGITQMKIGLGFEGGIAVVILAIILDRVTQGIAQKK